MALLAFEGWDWAADSVQPGEQDGREASGLTLETTIFRTGRAALGFSGAAHWYCYANTAEPVIITGVAIYWPVVTASALTPFLTIADAITGPTPLVTLALTTGGKLRLIYGYGGGSEATLWTSAATEPAGTWCYYEIKAALHPSRGAVTVRRNLQTLVSLHSRKTAPAALYYGNQVRLASVSSGHAFFADDFYFCDGGGIGHNDFAGDVRVRYLPALADDAVTWEYLVGGATNAACVDDTAADDSTSYTRPGTGIEDRFTAVDLPETVAAVRAVAGHYRQWGGDSYFVVTSGGVKSPGPLDTGEASYRNFQHIWATDPATSVTWTPSGVDAALIGYEQYVGGGGYGYGGGSALVDEMTQCGLNVLCVESLESAEVNSICLLWQIDRRDGTTQRFAGLDADVTWGGWTWSAASPFDATAAEAQRSLAAGNLEVAGVLTSGQIEESDLLNGVYDAAAVTVLRVDWQTPSRGAQCVLAGTLGVASASASAFTAEIRPPAALLQQPMMETYSAECRVDFGSARCGIPLGSWTVTGSVTYASSRSRVEDYTRAEASGYFTYGVLTMTSGANAGASREVRRFASGVIDLWEPFAADVAFGDTYSLTAGCNKLFSTCKDKFNNVINFRGFPTIPGTDDVFRYPDAR